MTFVASKNSASAGAPPGLQTRVVLIGASNLTKGLGTVFGLAQQAFGPGLDVHAAVGHGRSYGASSSVLGRRLPGILQCGLWSALDVSSGAQTAALVTDIGNDILYEQPVERIARWVETVLDRLSASGARTVITLLPEENLPKISPARFLLMRSILVPRCRLGLETISQRVTELNAAVRELAARRECAIVAQRNEWYGFDPMHIRLSQRRGAWREVVSGWFETDRGAPQPQKTHWRTAFLRFLTPEQRRVWGFEQRGRQPAARFADGTTVSIY